MGSDAILQNWLQMPSAQGMGVKAPLCVLVGCHSGLCPGQGGACWLCLQTAVPWQLPVSALSSCSITLIECGPVNTSFLANLQSTVTEGSVLQGLDPQTCALYSQYLQHCQSLFRDVAQDTEEVLQVAPSPLLLCPGERGRARARG